MTGDVRLLFARLLPTANAKRAQHHVEWRKKQGAPMIGSDAEDLVVHALMCFLGKDPAFNPQQESELKYFEKRIDHELRTICRRHENQPSKYRFQSIDPESGSNLVSLPRVPTPEEILQDKEEFMHFVAWLKNNDADLVEIACFYLANGFGKPREDAAYLRMPVTELYKLRQKLFNQAKNYFRERRNGTDFRS